MASMAEMGEVDDLHSKDTPKSPIDEVLVNGDAMVRKDVVDSEPDADRELMEPIVLDASDATEELDDSIESIATAEVNHDAVSAAESMEESPESPKTDTELKVNDDVVCIAENKDEKDVEQVDITSPEKEKAVDGSVDTAEVSDDDVTFIHTIDSDDDDMLEPTKALPVEDEDDTDDVMIVEDDDDDDDVKENGRKTPEKMDVEPEKPEKVTPRRSTRQIARKMLTEFPNEISDESDIEEVVEQDPLVCEAKQRESTSRKARKSSTIVVSDTKRLVEIATKQTNANMGKKEPTLVIIDTNSLLAGRAAVAGMPNAKSAAAASAFNMLPMALPAQGMYPTNMRATITPIPMNNQKPLPNLPAMAAPSAILPSLTDDMFVVEAPSFIVPYVYEKPPIKDFREYVEELKQAVKDATREAADDDSKSDKDVEEILDTARKEDERRHDFFDSPIGKFFNDIGCNLVQEYVQTDLLKQQKKKRDREGGANTQTNKTIQSLIKSLEYTKENNEPFRSTLKRCEFCNYKTDSLLAMAFHLETPHMKNFVYRCNFCTYEVRSPHDILFHMEAEHSVRGRLERAPAFHQCPNCPFEENLKSKLSRHSIACAKKFKPERNMEPPMDWEPPAKIPRQPRIKNQPNLAMTAAMYQAMAKSTQQQFLKVQQSMNQSPVNRGRGRPSLGSTSGGSVLVPTNFQISGNQLFQVVGGQELGNRLGGPIGLIPTLSSTSNAVTIQPVPHKYHINWHRKLKTEAGAKPTLISTYLMGGEQKRNNAPAKTKSTHQPSISITPLPRGASSTAININPPGAKPGDSNSKNSFVICEICDGYIKDLEQLRNHMQWIHKVKIHPKMIYNRPPLNCQKCQFRFFTDQGLERHLLGSHGLVTSSMQEAANKSKDSGRCPVCGKVYQWKLLNHVAKEHNMSLKPAHLSYKCTVCTATFGMYKQFENHVYSAHSVVAKRSIDKKNNLASSKNDSLLKPLKINDEITIIPQMPKSNGSGSSKDNSATISSRNNAAGTSGSSRIAEASIARTERLARRKSSFVGDK